MIKIHYFVFRLNKLKILVKNCLTKENNDSKIVLFKQYSRYGEEH